MRLHTTDYLSAKTAYMRPDCVLDLYICEEVYGGKPINYGSHYCTAITQLNVFLDRILQKWSPAEGFARPIGIFTEFDEGGQRISIVFDPTPNLSVMNVSVPGFAYASAFKASSFARYPYSWGMTAVGSPTSS